MKANVALINGEVVGVIGVERQPEFGVFFSDFKPQLQPYLKSITIMRAIKDAMTFVEQYRGPVLSHAATVEGCIVLNRLGFTHMHGAWYGWLKQSPS
jgi:hypothetical protein